MSYTLSCYSYFPNNFHAVKLLAKHLLKVNFLQIHESVFFHHGENYMLWQIIWCEKRLFGNDSENLSSDRKLNCFSTNRISKNDEKFIGPGVGIFEYTLLINCQKVMPISRRYSTK